MSEIKTDCFGYDENKCNVMTSLVCEKSKCSFYKTWEQEQKDRKKYGFKLRNINMR